MFRTWFHPTLGKDITCLYFTADTRCQESTVACLGVWLEWHEWLFARTSTDQAGRGDGLYDVITINSSEANYKLQAKRTHWH